MIFLMIVTIIIGGFNVHDWLNVEYQKGLDAITQKTWMVEFNQTSTGLNFKTYGKMRKAGLLSSTWMIVN